MSTKRNPGNSGGTQARLSGLRAAGRGFTVVEMLITLGVAAIFASLALPSFVNTIRNSRLLTTAEMLQTDLLVARREAIKRNTRVLVCPAAVAGTNLCGTDYTKWADGWVVCYRGTTNSMCDTNVEGTPNPILRRGKLDGTLALTGPTSWLAFNANGSATNSAGTLAAPAQYMVQGTWIGATTYYTNCVQGSGNIGIRKDKACTTL